MFPLFLIATFTLATAAVALSLRNLIRSALLLTASWAGLAAFYLWAGAEFVAFAQLLVYVGAVSMVVLFAVLLTRRSREDLVVAPDAPRRLLSGLLVGGAVFGVLCGAVISTPLAPSTHLTPTVTVKSIGLELLGRHTASLLVIGILLTVALLGALVIASQDKPDPS